MGASFEKQTSASTTTYVTYYEAGGVRVAMRTVTNGVHTLRWLLGDLLGSATTVAAGASGALLAATFYEPWGERYPVAGTMPTNRLFTGQILDEVAGGLYFYGARYYDPALARFIQADTIVPEPGNPQDLNRYSYARNNPLKYTDPTGHYIFEVDPDDPIRYGTPLVRQRKPSAPNSPVERRARITKFFTHYPGRPCLGGKLGLGRAEVNFTDWEMTSGRLNEDSGSQWWQYTNGRLLMDRFVAEDIKTHKVRADLFEDDPAVQGWLGYIDNPGAETFWAAHNTSLRQAVKEAASIGYARNETTNEQVFMLGVLDRVYTLGDACAAGSTAACLGTLPQGPNLQLAIQIFYPKTYPAPSSVWALEGAWYYVKYTYLRPDQ